MQSHDNYGYVQTVPGELKFANKRDPAHPAGVYYLRPDDGTLNDEKHETGKQSQSTEALADTGPERENWGKGIEFLLSCIAMSVGLGNVWRFPFVALENGGGAFVLPYIVVLLVVGKPIYFMEMVIGQFSSRGSVKVYDFAPVMRGIGYGQILSIGVVSTYYASLMALTLNYLYHSMSAVLPWSVCADDWPNCVGSDDTVTNVSLLAHSQSSAELYFLREVLKEKDSIEDGIGMPDWRLVICLAVSWSLVLITMIKGVRSSGKASYFLAIFPYIILIVLLIRACTLPGAMNGIVFFLKPQWDQILNPKVWYSAVTQVFFSLSVCFGNIIMYASYNKFKHNVYRDATIVTTVDTFTSLLAGCTIFGILGHLAHQVGTDDVSQVVKGGTGLAFISYPEAIAKFDVFPQGFSFLFFFMLFILGIGSNVAMMSCIMTVIRDEFVNVKHWHAATFVAIIGFSIGIIYVTPGGQYILTLVDFFGAGFIAFVLAIGELAAISWIYGVDRFCHDIEFMLGFRPNFYWRWCWRVVTPVLMIVILLYTLIQFQYVDYKGYVYPDAAYAFGWCITMLGLFQLPIWAVVAIIKQKDAKWIDRVKSAFKPMANWGPRDPALLASYREFLASKKVA